MQGTGCSRSGWHGAYASHCAEPLLKVQAVPGALQQLGTLSLPTFSMQMGHCIGVLCWVRSLQRSSAGRAACERSLHCAPPAVCLHHLQVRVTKNVGGDVSLISWDDPALPAKEVYSAVLTADGKHALVKTPSGEGGKTNILAAFLFRPADRQDKPAGCQQQQVPMLRHCCHPRPVGRTACRADV